MKKKKPELTEATAKVNVEAVIRRKTLNEVRRKIKKLQRYDLYWEQMNEEAKGEYIIFDELYNWILAELKK